MANLAQAQQNELANEYNNRFNPRRFARHPPGFPPRDSPQISVDYIIPKNCELYQKVEPGDKIDIFQVEKNQELGYDAFTKLLASEVEVRATGDPGVITFNIGIGPKNKLYQHFKKDKLLRDLSFRFHNTKTQNRIDSMKLNGVWRSVLLTMDGEVTHTDPMIFLFHKNEVLIHSGNWSVLEYQMNQGSIELVENSTNASLPVTDKHQRLKYRFLESGRLELAGRLPHGRRKALIRLEKISAPESKAEEKVFDLLSKATSNPDYLQFFVAVPAQPYQPGSYLVPGTKEHVKTIGEPIINRNHVLSAKVVDNHRRNPSLAIELTPEGAERMGNATKNNIRKLMLLLIDGKPRLAPTINSAVHTSISIEGDFTKDELNKIASALVSKLGSAPDSKLDSAKRIPSLEHDIGNVSLAKIRQLMLAFHNYESTYQKFPVSKCKGGKPGPPFSWRVALLPYLGHEELFDQYNFDETWDSEANSKILKQMPDVFRHPSRPLNATETGYLGIAGKQGAFGIEKPKDWGRIADGASNTIFMIESKSDIPWTKPEDFLLDSLQGKSKPEFEKAFSEHQFFDKEAICVGIGDGSTMMLDIGKLQANVKNTKDKSAQKRQKKNANWPRLGSNSKSESYEFESEREIDSPDPGFAPDWMNLFLINDGNPVDFPAYSFQPKPMPLLLPSK